MNPKAVLALFLALPLMALGHGGEDHGDGPKNASKPMAPGQGIYFPKEAQFLLGVRTEPIGRRRLEARLMVPGKVVPRTDRYVAIFPPLSGRLLASGDRLPLVGEKVSKGQVLAVVQQSLSAPEMAQLAAERIKAEAAVGQANASMLQARRDLERLRSLSRVVASKEIQKAELAAKVAEQEVSRALRATLGEQVEPPKSLFAVLDSSVLWVEASVFVDDIGRIDEARSALVHVSAYQDRYFPAKLFNLGQTVDEATRAVKAIFDLANPEAKLRPGMFAEVAIGAGDNREMLAVPDAAVVEREGRKVVYVHTGPEEFFAREVVLGERDGPYWAVQQGLQAGDRAVTVGTYELRSAEEGR
ncbi:MAG: efflux RND transporter periplasmic adaptor subunit [Candidatus Wallbacteria bacterium]|nr:efflux RND transporter periplasmic adaptor subunit [Candidatus Wallbacteria bacterium]